MIYKQKGEQFLYKGACYKIGGRVLTTKASGYEGLFGRIAEIHTSREGVPELYCTFDTPALPSKRGMLEGASHEFRSAVLHTDCLAYHASVMTPEMVMPLASPEQDYVWQVIYAVTAHWATDGESGAYELPFTDLNDAKRQLQDDLWEEFQNGCVERWREKSQFVEMETEQSYEPYTGPVSTKGKKRNSAKKKEKKPAEKKTAAQKLASEAPEEEQISFGAFLRDMEKAS